MIRIKKRYSFFIPGPWIPYPQKRQRWIAKDWENARGIRFPKFRQRALIAAEHADLPYYPNGFPIGIAVKILTSRRFEFDTINIFRTITEALRYRCWMKPKVEAVYFRWGRVQRADQQMTKVTISRMDL